MQLVAAITLENGKVTSLYGGQSDQKTVYPATAHRYATQLEQSGADAIWLIDLDGSRSGQLANLREIEKVRRATRLPLLVASGVRTEADVEQLFSLGVDTVGVGSLAIEAPEIVKNLLEKYGPKKIAVVVGARKSGTRIMIGGAEKTDLDTLDFALSAEQLGVKKFGFTDLSRAGTLTFPNFDLAEKLAGLTEMEIFIAGGVSKKEQVRLLERETKITGVVISRAIFDRELFFDELKSDG